MTDTPCRLLLVEDDPGIGKMLEKGLAAEGYQVDWLRSLQSAIAAAREARHDLVVLDRMLPDGDGADFCSALRKFGLRAPVCMLTARDTLEDKLRGFEAGADDYLTKPFEFEELLVRLAALRRRAGPSSRVLALEPDGRSLAFGEARVKLTRREWLLMSHFVANEGALVTRAAIVGEVWGNPGKITENSADVYIGYLRRKLGEIGASARIETVRGEGFRFHR